MGRARASVVLTSHPHAQRFPETWQSNLTIHCILMLSWSQGGLLLHAWEGRATRLPLPRISSQNARIEGFWRRDGHGFELAWGFKPQQQRKAMQRELENAVPNAKEISKTAVWTDNAMARWQCLHRNPCGASTSTAQALPSSASSSRLRTLEISSRCHCLITTLSPRLTWTPRPKPKPKPRTSQPTILSYLRRPRRLLPWVKTWPHHAFSTLLPASCVTNSPSRQRRGF